MSTDDATGAPQAQQYDVVLLVERALSVVDAGRIRELHDSLDAQVVYHVLMPMADAAAAVEASLGAMGGDVMTPAMAPSQQEIDSIQTEHRDHARSELDATIEALRAAGAKVVETLVVTEPPVDALIRKVKEVGAQEAFVLTRAHLVSDFFHVDWTSRARRKLGVPVLHLIEHDDKHFDDLGGTEQAVTGG